MTALVQGRELLGGQAPAKTLEVWLEVRQEEWLEMRLELRLEVWLET